MTATEDYDYVVVGSGAGGGPLAGHLAPAGFPAPVRGPVRGGGCGAGRGPRAAHLARSGFRILLLEAGGDPCSEDETGRLMYEVPIFHGLSTEYKACAWNFFARHYTDDARP